MPTLNLFTNVPVDAVVASDILKDCTKAVAKIIGKPESYVMILLNGGVPIEFAGTEEPAAYGELISIGGLGPSVNGKLSSTIAEIIQTKLSIDSARFYVKFYDVETDWPNLGLFNFLHQVIQFGEPHIMRQKRKAKKITEGRVEDLVSFTQPTLKFELVGEILCHEECNSETRKIKFWSVE